MTAPGETPDRLAVGDIVTLASVDGAQSVDAGVSYVGPDGHALLVFDGVFAASRGQVMVSHAEGQWCLADGAVVQLTVWGRLPRLPLPTDPRDVLAWAREAVDQGAGHDCEEWFEAGVCVVCGQPRAARH